MMQIPDSLRNYAGSECTNVRFFLRGEQVVDVQFLQTPEVIYGTVSLKQERRIVLRDWNGELVSVVTSNTDVQVGPGHQACFICCKSNDADGSVLALVNQTLGYYYPTDSWRFFWERKWRKKRLFSNGDKAFEQFSQHCSTICRSLEPY